MTDPRTALITGASSGIGRALALWLARRGVRVFAAARRRQALEALATEAHAAGGTVEPVAMDVAVTSTVFEVVQRLEKESGGLDLVVANAGIGGDTYAKRIQWSTVEQIIQVNVTGASATLCAALPGMVARGRGNLVGISSLAALGGLPRTAAYCASKAFLSVFLESLRLDLVGTGVKVTSIQPGFVKSELTANIPRKLPLLLETADAADRIGRAILRGTRTFSFPWPLAAAMKGMTLLPARLYERAVRGAR